MSATSYAEFHRRSLEERDAFWAEQARLVDWERPWDSVCDDSKSPFPLSPQIVLVVEAQTTTQHAVQEALRQLGSNQNVNLIYNKTREFPGIEETYDYHYG